MDEKEIKRAGCFEGDKENPEALCQVPDCRFTGDCIWKKVGVVSGLGNDVEIRGKILQHG